LRHDEEVAWGWWWWWRRRRRDTAAARRSGHRRGRPARSPEPLREWGAREGERESERAERRRASVSVRPAEVFVAGPGSVASGGESKGRRSEDRTGRGNRGDVDGLRGGRTSLL